MDIEDGLFIFALLVEGKMTRSVGVFDGKFRNDGLESGVQASILAEARKDLAYSPMCAIDRTTLFAE